MRLHQHLRRDLGRHTDDWLITYADTITLLLCLFVVILSIRTSGHMLAWDAAPPVAPPVKHVAATEDIFGGHPPFPPPARRAVEQTAPEPSVPAMIVDTPDALPAMPERFRAPAERAALDSITDRADVAPVAPTRFVDAAAPEPRAFIPNSQHADNATATLPPVVEHMRSLGSAVIEQHGDRITTVQISSNAFFASGHAVLSGPGKAILRDVAETLKSDAFAAYHISIEGHTDDMPINTPLFQSNWELSTARASAVVRFFLELGLSPRKLSAAGYADTYPIAPNRNADGTVIPENQARNRRVVIKLEKIDKAER
jgi:chemotaxis protein MotB